MNFLWLVAVHCFLNSSDEDCVCNSIDESGESHGKGNRDDPRERDVSHQGKVCTQSLLKMRTNERNCEFTRECNVSHQ